MCVCMCVRAWTYFPMLSGRTCNEISLIERHVRFRSSGKLSGSLAEKKKETSLHGIILLSNAFICNACTQNEDITREIL